MLKRNLFWMFLNGLFVPCLLLFHPATSEAASPIYAYGYCVKTDGTSVFLTTPCVDSDPTQSWFWAPGNKLRNAGFPDKCLHVEGGTFTSMKGVVLHPCRDANYQQWFKSDASKPSGRLKAGSSSMCLTVAGGSYGPGRTLVLYACQQSVAQIWVWQSIPNMTNQMAAEWAPNIPGFHQFEQCVQEGSAKCKLTRQMSLTIDPEFAFNWAYGWHTGGGEGGAGAGKTLDFGDVHTLDRCAWAHDNNYWNLHTTCGQNVAFRRCLNKVVPGTPDEKVALDEAKTKYDGITLLCDVSDSITGTLPPR